MAEALTYDSLLTDVQVYAERDDPPFVDQIPRFIMLAENRLASEVHGLGFTRVTTTVLATNDPVLPKPVRWRETKSFSVTLNGQVSYLQLREYQYCRAFNLDGSSGLPRYYSDYDYEHWFIAPKPSAGMAAEILYHERPDPLSLENQTNWTTRYAPQLLLYATLLEAMPFLKTSERIPEFQGLYDRALQAINAEDTKRKMPDQAGVRS